MRFAGNKHSKPIILLLSSLFQSHKNITTKQNLRSSPQRKRKKLKTRMREKKEYLL